MKSAIITTGLLYILASPLHAQEPKKVVLNAVDAALEHKISKEETRRRISNLAEQLGDNEEPTTDQELIYTFELLFSEDCQRYISQRVIGKPKTMEELSFLEKIKIKFGYPQLVHAIDYGKEYIPLE